ncbi:Thiamine-monophosphate kinase [Candidatus Providencia siddallii]|uniref:Thiamine-monophosphate kinase n=1 Tax=Candidatus Providencia siddallii TaxID=1715285 RepID=A0A0M6W6W9_9GAMM|nr:Thiamine-monophosphate kinase [Candidatus Providencia siddallii]
MLVSEFDIISHYFDRQSNNRSDVNIGIGDDCALMTVPNHYQLAISTDTFVSGIHFLPEISPDDFACKSLLSSLSDLAAIGADPAWISLAITLPYIDNKWLKSFSDSFFNKLNYYKIQLIGGDTTRGPMSVTYTVYGFVPYGQALLRSGACVGDWIYVTGTLGDSAAGLAILQDKLKVKNNLHKKILINRHLRPKPRFLQGKILRNFASSAIDISDGLVSDLKHILKASCCGAYIKIDNLPQSEALKQSTTTEQNHLLSLSGGEDYELCFTVSEINLKILEPILLNTGLNFTRIGQIKKQSYGIRYYFNNKEINLDIKGFDHFISYL